MAERPGAMQPAHPSSPHPSSPHPSRSADLARGQAPRPELYRPSHELPAVQPELAHARATLEAFVAPNESQRRERERFLRFLDEHPRDAHERGCLAGHLTASALLLDARAERVLLMQHKKLGRWLQFGGHCDGDANLCGVALRETLEESGIRPAAITSAPVDIDIHEIPVHGDTPAHLHYDVRFLAWAAPGARASANEESLGLTWFERAEAARLELDDSLRRLLLLGFASAPPSERA